MDLFALTRRLGHRMGLASWAGPGSAEGDPIRAAGTGIRHSRRLGRFRTSGRHGHCRGLEQAGRTSRARRRRHVVETALRAAASDIAVEDLFGRIVQAWASEPVDVRLRGIAIDVALIHIASMSNLMAALGLALVDLLEHPASANGWRRATRTSHSDAHWKARGSRSARSWPASCWHPSSSIPAM